MSNIREAYLKALKLEGADEGARQKRQCALQIAHDLRKYEIDLLWRRSTYLWGFQIVAFAGIAALTSALFSDADQLDPQGIGLHSLFVALLICCFGLGTSLMWFFTARASRIWFYNWEKHIDLLEDEFSGSLYKTLFFRRDERIYSLTGINEAATTLTIIFWIVLLLACVLLSTQLANLFHMSAILGTSFFIVAIGAACFFRLAPSRAKDSMRKLDNILPMQEGVFYQRDIDPKRREAR